MNNEADGENPQDVGQFRHLVELGDKGRRKENDAIAGDSHEDVEEEYRGLVGFVAVWLAYEGVPETAVNKGLAHRDKNSEHGNHAVVVRRQKPCQENAE